jgi:hypothetical protein
MTWHCTLLWCIKCTKKHHHHTEKFSTSHLHVQHEQDTQRYFKMPHVANLRSRLFRYSKQIQTKPRLTIHTEKEESLVYAFSTKTSVF